MAIRTSPPLGSAASLAIIFHNSSAAFSAALGSWVSPGARLRSISRCVEAHVIGANTFRVHIAANTRNLLAPGASLRFSSCSALGCKFDECDDSARPARVRRKELGSARAGVDCDSVVTLEEQQRVDRGKPFVLFSPFRHVNASPQMGRAYSTLAADALARFQLLVCNGDSKGENQKYSSEASFPSEQKQGHDWIKKSEPEQNPYVANNLLKRYITSGRLQNAQELFNKLGNKDTVSWTILIGGYAKHGHAEDAFEVYKKMRSEGGRPDAVTYLSALSACASPIALNWGKDIHADIVRDGFQADERVCNALVNMYARCGSVDDAKLVFDNMVVRDVSRWNTIIGALARQGRGQEAFSSFLKMQSEGVQPDVATHLSILNSNACEGALAWVKDVHSHAVRSRLDADLRVGSALVHMYAKCGSVDDARMVFGRMRKRNVISWNGMIGGLAQQGHGLEAVSLFHQMQKEGFTPNSTTYLCLLSARADSNDLAWVKEVHSQATNSGLGQNLSVNTAFIHMYAKCGSVEDAKLVFDSMKNRDVICWTAMIGALAQNGLGHEAFSFFLEMQKEGVIPNALTYTSILNSNACEGALAWVKEVHSHASKSGLNTNLRVGSALVHMYAKSGSIEDAKAVFDIMEDRDVMTWNAMIGGLAQHGLGHEAFSLFLQMQSEGFKPNSITYVSILNPCSSTGALEWVKNVHTHAMKAGLDVDLRVGNALILMYAKSGSIADARQVFSEMVKRDVVSWTVMIGALAQHGHGREALQLAEEMIAEGVEPTGTLFVAVLSACSHSGLVDECRLHLLSMTLDYGIEPALEHYTCMVDTLGRAGHLEEARFFILSMSIKPDNVTWKALLGACRIYNDTKLAELGAKECLKLEPLDPSPYVLLSNLYAVAGDWDQVSSIRGMMQERGIRKYPGQCWIEVENKVHHFVSGDISHPEVKEIYAMLDSLFENLKTEGYVPDTRLVLRNIDDEDKESSLFSHSEKLAIAYGLMHETPGKAIRIFKNLRICSDCHTASKFISKVTGREIVARDANRFHHFKDGFCSCGDYW